MGAGSEAIISCDSRTWASGPATLEVGALEVVGEGGAMTISTHCRCTVVQLFRRRCATSPGRRLPFTLK